MILENEKELYNSEFGSNFESLTREKQILRVFEIRDRIFKKELAEILRIRPTNLNRIIDKLSQTVDIKKDKEGRNVFYFIPKTPEPPISETKTISTQDDPIKIRESVRIRHEDTIIDVLETYGPTSRAEMIERTGISTKNIDAYVRKPIREGRIIREHIGKNSYYRLPETQLKKVKSLTNLEVFINQIPPLKEFNTYGKKKKRYSPKTIDAYDQNIVHFYRWKDNFNERRFTVHPVERFTIKDVDDFVQYLTDNNYSDQAIRNAEIALKSYFKFLKRHDYITKDIMEDYTFTAVQERDQPAITLDNFWAMVAEVQRQWAHEEIKNQQRTQDLTLLLLMLDTGARAGEIARVCIKNINFDQKLITINGEKGKGLKGMHTERELPLANITLEYLKKTIEANKTDTPVMLYEVELGNAVFLNKDQFAMKDRQVRDFVKNLREKLRFKEKITVHSFRRWLSNYLLTGMRPDFISQRIGQVPKNKMLVRYAKMAPEYKQEYDRQYRATHPLFKRDFVAKFQAIVEGEA